MVRNSLAASQSGCVSLFGELVSVLVEDGDAKSALQLERWGNELSASLPFGRYCAYDETGFTKNDSLAKTFCSLCDEHDAVIPNPNATGLARGIPNWWMALQIQASRLRLEVKRRERAELRLERDEGERLQLLVAILKTGRSAKASKQRFGWIVRKLYEVCAGAFRERSECEPGSSEWYRLTGEIAAYDELIRAADRQTLPGK